MSFKGYNFVQLSKVTNFIPSPVDVLQSHIDAYNCQPALEMSRHFLKFWFNYPITAAIYKPI